jgi:asparagine synthase (glutamine-hydrolysing)
MTEHLKSRHTFLECNASQQAGLLTQSVLAHDGPAMADISSSLLYFCHQVSRKHKVAFTGECADEVFGGYPWYHNRMASTPAGFPWSPDLSPRQLLLRDDFLGKLDMENYVRQVYQDAVNTVSFLPEDSPENRRHRQLFVLTTRFFMQTLLDRMDRAASWCGMEALVPFADLDLVEYLYNVPWEMKAKDGDVKHVLKEIAAPYLPADVLQRKKSPYPKNYHPQYEQLLCREMKQILGRRNHPVNRFLDPDKVLAFCQAPMDTHKPWYGQLMAGPQLLAYYLQIDYWLRSYDVTVNI